MATSEIGNTFTLKGNSKRSANNLQLKVLKYPIEIGKIDFLSKK
jgi:hypothetical protein